MFISWIEYRSVNIMASRDGFPNKQKHLRQNSSSSHNNMTTPALISPLAKQLNTDLPADEDPNSFYQIISDIMRGFGDCERPLEESVLLVEKILLQQLRGILNEVLDVALKRKGSPHPTQRDFEFLMRNNPTKVFRLQKHVKDLQMKRKLEEVYKGRPSTYEDELDTNGAMSDDDQDRDVAERYDEEKIRRLFRADRISQPLNGVQYKEYNEARRSSFYCRNSMKIRIKLRRWIKSDVVLSNQVFTILSYLAHETIAAIVDFAILTRLNSANRLHEPFHRVISSSKKYLFVFLYLTLIYIIEFNRNLIYHAAFVSRSDPRSWSGWHQTNYGSGNPRSNAKAFNAHESIDGYVSKH